MPSPTGLQTNSGTAASVDSKVDEPVAAYKSMREHWDLPDDLLGGTPDMRRAGVKWLPKHEAEASKSWLIRRDMSVLFPAYKDTIKRIVDKPTSQPVTVEGLPESMEYLVDDVDGFGTSLHDFVHQLLKFGIHYGHSGVFTDFPTAPENRTKQDEKELNLRPVFILYPASQIIGWRFLPGTDELEQVRFIERKDEPKGDWGTEVVEYVRVITPDGFKLYRKAPSESEYSLHDEGFHTFGSIPLEIFYTESDSPMISEPPLEDLAWLNLSHWQSQSDHRNILRYARVGILFGSGLTDDQVENGLVIGPTQFIGTTDTDADLKFVEHSGASIGAGRQDLRDLEEKMEVLGMKPFAQRRNGKTLGDRVIDEDSGDTAIHSWVRNAERTIEQAFHNAAAWMEVGLPEDFAVNIFSEFSIGSNAESDSKTLRELQQDGIITKTTRLKEIQRRGILPDDMDAEAEVEEASEEFDASMPTPFDDITDRTEEPPKKPEEKPKAKDGPKDPPEKPKVVDKKTVRKAERKAAKDGDE